MILYQRIKERRIELHLTQEELAKKMGYKSRSSINKIELGENDIPQSKIEQFAKALNTTPAYLMGWDDTPGVPLPDEWVNIQHVAHVAAGYDGYAKADIMSIEAVPRKMLYGYPPNECKMLTVKGNSMYPMYLDGDSVIYHEQTSVDSGTIAVVQYNGDEVTLKKVVYMQGEDWMELVPLNPDYMPLRIEGADLQYCRVYGKVISLTRGVQK